MSEAQIMMQAAQKIQSAASLMAEVEAMKAANKEREHQGQAPAYGEEAFRNAIATWTYY